MADCQRDSHLGEPLPAIGDMPTPSVSSALSDEDG